MKTLNNYISEKLLINKNYKQHCNFKPSAKDELTYIINERYQKSPRIMDLNDIDVSQITDMSFLFRDMLKLEELHVETWNVGNVIDFSNIFKNCVELRMDLSNWDVSSGTNFTNMFCNCHEFNSDLSNWDVSDGQQFRGMFFGCEKFNSNLSKWDVSEGKYFNHMFYNCYNFNSDLSQWDVNKDAYLDCMFYNCEKFNCDLDGWNINKDKYMGAGMFYNCKSLERLPKWYK